MNNSSSSTYKLICGMEVHAELKTASKMFCSCKNDPFGASKPNCYTCPTCLGMPGALPVMNRKAIEWTIKLGLALGCEINLFSKFDRKHYFYPDLPKGYQISQYDLPFCHDGYIETSEGKIRIRRIHLEEDTGKLQHKTIEGKKVSLIDFNRGGVPLVEIVTEPDIHTAAQAKAYAKAIRQLLRFLDIADCDMEQGGMRLEANISLSPSIDQLPNYKVEVKNINSFRFLEHAISYEIERQTKVLADDKTPAQETRGWNEPKGETVSQRSKEDAEDYRYFPDPDLPPMHFSRDQIETWRKELPELPSQLAERWSKEFGVEAKYAEVLLENRASAEWVEHIFAAAKKDSIEPNQIANAIVNKKIKTSIGQPADKVVSEFKTANQTATVDPSQLETIIQKVLSEQPDAVAQYKAGKVQILGFLMGQVQRQLGQKVDAAVLMTQLKAALGA